MTRIAIEPKSSTLLNQAVISSGAQVAQLDHSVTGLVWTDYHSPDLLKQTLEANPQLKWVQLPFAGVDAFADILDMPFKFTSAKGAYSEPVAEHALALCLALGRKIPDRVRAKSWGEKFAVSLYESRVLIVGGGGISKELLRLLAPFGCEVIVVRNRPEHLAGVAQTVTYSELDVQLPKADFVILAAALTPETTGMFDYRRMALMKSSAFLINVARGKHIKTPDLVKALTERLIAGAALDVTDPEPLPDGHELWGLENCLITPHTADTPEQVNRLFAQRVAENAKAFLGAGQWVGEVDPKLGY